MIGGKVGRTNNVGVSLNSDDSTWERYSANGFSQPRTQTSFIKNTYIIMIILFLSCVVFAANPSIVSITHPQFYAGKTNTITVTINPDTTNGILEFYEGTSLISQKQYTSSSTSFEYPKSWSNPNDINLTFKLKDINGENTITTDDSNSILIHVKKGINLEVLSISTTPTRLEAQNTARITTVLKNSGDENTPFNPSISYYYDGNLIVTNLLPIFDINQEITQSIDWTPPADFNGGNLRVFINNNNLFQEFSLNDNEKVLSLNSVGLADLIASDIITKENFRKDFLETINLLIDNNGNRPLENVMVEVFIDSIQDDKRVFSTFFSIGGNSRKTIDFVYSFNEIKEYKFIFTLNRDRRHQESNYSNNQLEKRISVFDFNLQAIVEENDKLRNELSIANAKYNGEAVEKQTCLSSLSTLRSENESCSSNLSVCNENNNTKISNYMMQIDANRDAEKSIYLGEINRIGQEKNSLKQSYETQVATITEEKNQWAALVCLILVSVIGFILYENLLKNRTRKAVNTSGGF